MSSAAKAFRSALESNREFASEIETPEFPLQEFLAVQEWQRNRFRVTYADFTARPSDQPACEFFLQELYGGLDFRKRDQDVSRVEPVMSRLLPDKALRALAEALRLQRISLDLDLSMALEMRASGELELDDRSYVRTYCRVGRPEQRQAQIDMIRSLGHELQSLTRTPMLLALVKAVRKPAIAAGFGELQAFLENGLSSFRQLRDAGQFVESIHQRESRLMHQWFASCSDAGAVQVSH